jgi:hypothetical protein
MEEFGFVVGVGSSEAWMRFGAVVRLNAPQALPFNTSAEFRQG